MAIDPDFWLRRRVLVTGHTGFKGAWLSLWLESLGADVTGLASGPPTAPSLYQLAAVGRGMREQAVDVRDREALARAIAASDPEIVLHLAAQPMVRRSLREPVLTYEVNVMGTVNVLEAVRTAAPGVRAVLVVTSDKCYANDGSGRAFAEGDPLGGEDPYSSSKAAAELVTAAYRSSYSRDPESPRLASARAGNVIGGGDWGEDRLLPDALRAVESGQPLRIRNPNAVRPWQHVLNPLCGYLLLAQELCRRAELARAWNFGPPAHDARPVGWIVQRLGELWQGELSWELDEADNPPEAAWLELDSSDAQEVLGWRAGWAIEEGLARAVEWHRSQRAGADMREVSLAHLEDYRASLREQ